MSVGNTDGITNFHKHSLLDWAEVIWRMLFSALRSGSRWCAYTAFILRRLWPLKLISQSLHPHE
jgi:hypothetical protein